MWVPSGIFGLIRPLLVHVVPIDICESKIIGLVHVGPNGISRSNKNDIGACSPRWQGLVHVGPYENL